MRRTLSTWLMAMKHRLLAACGSGLLALGWCAGQLPAQEPAAGSALTTAVHRISDDDESPTAQASAEAYAAPYGAQAAAGSPSAGYFYSSFNNLMGGDNSYFDATGGRTPNSWGGEWGYGNDCHIGQARVEYLMWFSRGRNAPPLVTTSPTATPQAQAGVLGVPTTDILYGQNPIGDNMRNGARISLSRLLADERTWLEGRFWGVEESTERFFTDSNDHTIIARPFVNTVLGIEDSLLVNYPGVASNGSINVLSKNDMLAADAWLRRTWSDDGCTRIDFLAGYQFARIDDFIGINNTMTSIDPVGSVPIGTLISNADAFQTQNEFHGGQLGFMIDRRKGAWSLEVLGKIGLGNMRQRVAIRGLTTVTVPNLPPASLDSGFLAQPSNIGVFQRNQFAFIPEVNINLVYNLSPSWRLMGGYTFIYFSDIALAANQIDREVNLSQVPGPPVGALRPQFRLVNSDFIVQGMSLGAEYRW